MEEQKKNMNRQIMSEHDEQELWFSSLVANDSHTYNPDDAFKHFWQRVSSTEQSYRVTFRLPKFIYRVAAIATLLIAFTTTYWWGKQQLQNQFTNILVEAPLGAKTKLILPDSTLVWLNAGTKIQYSQGFGIKKRQLQLDGEAYFEVKKNPNVPFEVATKELQVSVLGTKFNLRNYKEEENVSVALLEGKVKLKNCVKETTDCYLSPSEMAILSKNTGQMTITRSEVQEVKMWTNNRLLFDEVQLSEIIKELNRSYNVKIIIADNHLANRCFYAQFNKEKQTIYEVLDALTATNQLDYRIKGDSILIYNKK